MDCPIRQIWAREVLDSRGWPTVEVEVRTDHGGWGRALVPSGASTGRAEACELRDADPSRYAGRGVRQAVENVRSVLAPALLGLDAANQAALDRRLTELDGSPQKSRLGANALLGVSLAAAHAAAQAQGRPLYEHLFELARAAGANPAQPAGARQTPTGPRLPMPMVNLISGGLHAGGQLDFQDFLAIPQGAPNLDVALTWISAIYHALGRLLRQAGYEGYLVGDEGGFGPRLADAQQAAALVAQAIEQAGLEPGRDVVLAIDVASSHFHRDGRYHLRGGPDRGLSAGELTDQLEALADRFPIVSFEDGLAEDDWSGWRELTERLGRRLWLVGDDLFATQTARLQQGIAAGAANSVLIKYNQVGTLSETLQAVALARSAGYQFVVSARSGETEDATLADLAVAVAAPSIKIGSLARGERLAKYNQLLRIAERLPPATGPWSNWRTRPEGGEFCPGQAPSP